MTEKATPKPPKIPSYLADIAARHRDKPKPDEIKAAVKKAHNDGEGLSVVEIAAAFACDRQQVYRWLGKGYAQPKAYVPV